MRSPVFTAEIWGDILTLREWWTSTCKKQVISKPSDIVVWCYLALDAFYVGLFSEINLIAVKVIVLINFFVILNGF